MPNPFQSRSREPAWGRRPRPWWRTSGDGIITGIIIGFAFCYIVAAALMFHFLITVGYPWQMALPRAAIWMWTARVGTTILAEDMAKGHIRINPFHCDNPRDTWC